MAVPQKKRFGDILVEGGLITATQLQQALDYGREQGLKLGNSLQRLGFVNELDIARTLSRQLRIPFVDLNKIVIDPDLARTIPEIIARKHKVIAIGRKEDQLLVAFVDPLNIFATDEVDRQTKERLVVCIAVESLILSAIDTIYSMADKGGGKAKEVDGSESEAVVAVNEVMLQAVKDGASDIHIEPDDEKIRVRLRVDGVLHAVKEYPLELHPSIVSRVKIMANLDIGERRKPQDGRFEITIAGRSFDIRTSILPLNRGEKVVMRLLDKSKIKITLHDLGFSEEQHQVFTEHLMRPHEIILVTGPTGSGKTTTLYGALNQINDVGRNIVTVEDPVEYELRGVNQVQINPRAELTFVTALRSILRQDPDVVMIGEIRDVETAEIAMQAALTGHLVLSTLHTNDAAGAIARLIDMGIAPFLIASSVGLVVAQRLVRLLCPQCRQRFVPPEGVQRDLGLDYDTERYLFKAAGCSHCEGSGYRGRVAIYEILPVSDAVEAMIMEKASSRTLFRQAQNEGLVSLREAGLSKVLAGLTSLEELMRVTMADKE
jgi:type IV pilus assembly protein PilB